MARSETTPLALPAAPAPAAPASRLGLPADHGLTAAGLMAQAAGTLGMGLALVASAALVLSGSVPRATRTLLLVAAFVGTIRSVAHILAGLSLVKRSPLLFRHVSIYAGLAAFHTIVLAVAFRQVPEVPLWGPVATPALIALSLGWPVALYALVVRRANRRLLATANAFDLAVMTADRGVASAGALMVAGGTLAAAAGAVVCALGLLGGFSGLLLVAAIVVLARSLVHVWAGFAALAEPSAARFERLVTIYRVAAFVATLAVVAALMGQASGGALGFLFLVVLAMSWFLGWPFALTGFARHVRALDGDGAHEGGAMPRLAPAPDAGLTGLGYLLLWYGTIALGLALDMLRQPGALIALGLAELCAALLFLWAGRALALMRPTWRRTALVAAGAGLALGVFVVLAPIPPPAPTHEGLLGLFTVPDSELLLQQRWIAGLGSVVLPLVTLGLVLRLPQAKVLR